MKVSLFLPVYNGSKYLLNALESIEQQTYKNIELFICDHGSTDSTKSIIEKHVSKYECKKYYFERTKKDTKYTAARPLKEMMKDSIGDLIMFFSHDDVLLKDYVSNNVMAYQEKTEMRIWNSPIWWFDSDSSMGGTVKPKMESGPRMYEYSDMDDLKVKMLERSVVNTPSVVFTKGIFEEVGMTDEKYSNAGDYEHFLRMIDRGIFIYQIPKFMGYFYGVNLGQCTQQLHSLKDGYDIEKLQEEYRKKWTQ